MKVGNEYDWKCLMCRKHLDIPSWKYCEKCEKIKEQITNKLTALKKKQNGKFSNN